MEPTRRQSLHLVFRRLALAAASCGLLTLLLGCEQQQGPTSGVVPNDAAAAANMPGGSGAGAPAPGTPAPGAPAAPNDAAASANSPK
jgi:hypothetical protein